MPAGTLDDRYLEWLYSQVAIVKTRRGSSTYWKLLKQLYTIEFTWFVPNDGNRAEDGRDLRSEWVAEFDPPVEENWIELGCSFLEMLIALSRRISFQTEKEPDYWFWHLLDNLELHEFHDRCHFLVTDVEECVMRVMNRSYNRDGYGGLFPLRHPTRDQRRVELWYQLGEYLLQDQ